MMTHLEAAKAYLSRGLAVIPLWTDRRKNPRISSYLEYTERLPTEDEITRWWKQWPRANLGILTGYWQRFVALDFDTDAEYQLWAAQPGSLVGQTWTVKTGRGYHIWFELETEPGKSRMFTHPDGGEVLLRAKGGYVIAPPSIHHSGKRYTTVHKLPPLKIESIAGALTGWQEKTLKAAPTAKPKTTLPHSGLRIEDIIEPIGRPNGRGAYKAHCPFHDDEKPSAWVNPEQGRFGCNACYPGMWWDVVNVYAMLHGIDNGEAFKQLRSGDSP